MIGWLIGGFRMVRVSTSVGQRSSRSLVICVDSSFQNKRVGLVLLSRRFLLVVGSLFLHVHAARSHFAVVEVLGIAFSQMRWSQSLLGWMGCWLMQ